MTAAAAALLSGCIHVPSDAEVNAEAEALARRAAATASQVEAQMSPEERAAYQQQVDARAMADMQARAAACGTSLIFAGQGRLVDRTVLIHSSATREQVACVQRYYPYAQASRP